MFHDARPLQAVLDYIFLYPLVMTYAWLIGALLYFIKWERKQPLTEPKLPNYPPISVLLPCHNEGDNVRETIAWLLQLNYPDYEIIAINDGSKDDTGSILDELAGLHPKLRVIHLATNQGKAMGLRMGALLSRSEYLVCIDGDAILEADACTWMMWHFLSSLKVGAVTGNPRIRNRSTLLGKIQVGEFSCIVGTIKRAQRIYGRLFSISGVICAFRKSALHRVGYWSPDMLTEDVDITWKLQRDGWDVRFEPHAKSWILMPETLKGLWKQRLRWAQGGAEVAIRNLDILWRPSQVHMLPIFAEFLLSLLWVYLFVGTSVGVVVAMLLRADIPPSVLWAYVGGRGAATVTVLTCFTQFGVGLFLDRRYEKGLWKSLLWIVWYPFYYWLIIACATFVGLPKALLKRRGQRAVWTSPDRGFRA
jgi:biofilm PGA synthesis N-glycosyltransferase PgaC